jgi:hypothetical protein
MPVFIQSLIFLTFFQGKEAENLGIFYSPVGIGVVPVVVMVFDKPRRFSVHLM